MTPHFVSQRGLCTSGIRARSAVIFLSCWHHSINNPHAIYLATDFINGRYATPLCWWSSHHAKRLILLFESQRPGRKEIEVCFVLTSRIVLLKAMKEGN